MDDCCSVPIKEISTLNQCPICQQKGKNVQLITLKALLKPSALESLNPKSPYAFCPNPSCEVIYFTETQIYEKNNLKVLVFQKDDTLEVPVCYCFGWTRERLIKAVQENIPPAEHIREQVQANRCGCEVNNPQGACCIGNVVSFIRSVDKT